MAMEAKEVIKKVLELLAAEGGEISCKTDDPKVKDFVSSLLRVEVRHQLSENHGVFIDMEVINNRVSIFRRDNSAGSVKAGKSRMKTKPRLTPKVDRTKHEFVPPPFHESVLRILQDEKPHNVWFWGPTGCGKTVYTEFLGRHLDMPVYRVNCREDMESATFLGDKTIGYKQGKDGSIASVIKFMKGVIVRAMQQGLDADGNEVGRPGILYVDEAAAVSPNIAIVLNRLLETDDPRRSIVLDDMGGSEIRSHSGMRVIFSANTQGRGANTMAEAGYTAQLEALDLSLLNRMTAYFRFGYNREAERAILQQKIGDDRLVERIIKFRDSLRAAVKQGVLSTPFSTRHIVAIGDMYRVLKCDIGEAVFRVLFDAVLPEERAKYNELAVAHLGEDLERRFAVGGMDFM